MSTIHIEQNAGKYRVFILDPWRTEIESRSGLTLEEAREVGLGWVKPFQARAVGWPDEAVKHTSVFKQRPLDPCARCGSTPVVLRLRDRSEFWVDCPKPGCLSSCKYDSLLRAREGWQNLQQIEKDIANPTTLATPQPEPELARCSQCGAKGTLEQRPIGGYRVECSREGCTSPMGWYRDRDAAIHTWNEWWQNSLTLPELLPCKHCESGEHPKLYGKILQMRKTSEKCWIGCMAAHIEWTTDSHPTELAARIAWNDMNRVGE